MLISEKLALFGDKLVNGLASEAVGCRSFTVAVFVFLVVFEPTCRHVAGTFANVSIVYDDDDALPAILLYQDGHDLGRVAVSIEPQPMSPVVDWVER